MYVSSINSINNASFNMMQGSASLMDLSRFAGSQPSQNTSALNQSEKRLLADKLQNELVYQASSYMEDSAEKIKKENIKRSFSTFA